MKNYGSLLFGIRYRYFSTCATISTDFTSQLGLHTIFLAFISSGIALFAIMTTS